MKSLLLFSLLAACTSSSAPTAATCPDSNAPTYGSFAKEFFTSYCTQCHSATANDRHDAPDDDNFDTEADILAHAGEIDAEAAKGPKSTNTDMPELGTAVKTAPTEEERALLGQYLACAQAKN